MHRNVSRNGGERRESGANTAYALRRKVGDLQGPHVRGAACVRLASWWGNGPPRRRSLAGLRGRSATLELRHGPDSYGRQQWGIFRNGRKPDGATPRG